MFTNVHVVLSYVLSEFFLNFFICHNLYRIFVDKLRYHVITLLILVAFISSPYDWKIIFPRKESRECISVCAVRSEVKVSGLPGSWLRTYRLSLLDLTWVKVIYWRIVEIQLNSLEVINHLVIIAHVSCFILFQLAGRTHMPGDCFQKLQLPLTEVFSIIPSVYWDFNPLENNPAINTRMIKIFILFPNLYERKTGSLILMDSLHVFWIEWDEKQLVGRKLILTYCIGRPYQSHSIGL